MSDEAVGDRHHCAGCITNYGAAQSEMFYAADFGIYLDQIADDVLVFEYDEETVDEVFQQALRAESDRDAGEARSGERGGDVKIQDLEPIRMATMAMIVVPML